MRTKRLIKVILVIHLHMIHGVFLPRPPPHLERPDPDRCRGSHDKHISPILPRRVHDVHHAHDIYPAQAIIKDPFPLGGADGRGGVEDAHGPVCHGLGPGLGEGGLDAGERGDVCFHVVAG